MGDMAEELRAIKQNQQSSSPRSSAGRRSFHSPRDMRESSPRSQTKNVSFHSSDDLLSSSRLRRTYSERSPQREQLFPESGTGAASGSRHQSSMKLFLPPSPTASQIDLDKHITISRAQAGCHIPPEKSNVAGESVGSPERKQLLRQKEQMANQISSLERRLDKSLNDNYELRRGIAVVIQEKKNEIKKSLRDVKNSQLRLQECVQQDMKNFGGRTIQALAKFACPMDTTSKEDGDIRVQTSLAQKLSPRSARKVNFFGGHLRTSSDSLCSIEENSAIVGSPRSADNEKMFGWNRRGTSASHSSTVGRGSLDTDMPHSDSSANQIAHLKKLLHDREEEWRQAWDKREEQLVEREREWNENHLQWESLHRYWKQQQEIWREQHEDLTKYIATLRSKLDTKSNFGHSPRKSPQKKRQVSPEFLQSLEQFDDSVRKRIKDLIESFFSFATALCNQVMPGRDVQFPLEDTKHHIQTVLFEEALTSEANSSIVNLLSGWTKFVTQADDSLLLLSKSLLGSAPLQWPSTDGVKNSDLNGQSKAITNTSATTENANRNVHTSYTDNWIKRVSYYRENHRGERDDNSSAIPPHTPNGTCATERGSNRVAESPQRSECRLDFTSDRLSQQSPVKEKGTCTDCSYRGRATPTPQRSTMRLNFTDRSSSKDRNHISASASENGPSSRMSVVSQQHGSESIQQNTHNGQRGSPAKQPRPPVPSAPRPVKRPAEPPSDVGISMSLPRLGGVEVNFATR